MPAPDIDITRDLLDSQPESVVYYTPVRDDEGGAITDFTIAYCNLEASVLTGVSPDTLLNSRVRTMPGTTPDVARMLFDAISDVYTGGKRAESTYFNPALGKHFQVIRTKVRDGVLTIARDRTNDVVREHQELHQAALVNGILDASINGVMAAEAVRTEEGIIEDFVIVRINPAFTRIIGLTEQQAHGKSLLEIFPGVHENGAFDLYAGVVRSGNPAQQELYYEDARIAGWYELSVVKLDDGIVATFTDVTVRRQATEDLQRQKALLDNVLTYSPSGITVTEVIRNSEGRVIDGRTILANDMAELFTGVPKADMLSMTVAAMDPAILDSPLFQMALQTLANGKPFITQYFLESSQRWLELSVARMDADRLINVFTDITTTKNAQLNVERSASQLTTVVNTAQAGMFTLLPVTDEAGTVTDFRFGIVNQAVASYIGETAANLAGALGSVYFPAYKANGLFNTYLDTFQNGTPHQFPFHYEDGYDVYFDIRTAKVEDGVLVTFTDQTDLRRLQRSLEASIDELKRSNANLEEFAYAASHDLKEPIRKVHFFADRLRQQYSGVLDADGLRTLERLGVATERMKRLVDDLLDYSHVSMSTGAVEPVDLNRKLQLIRDDLELSIAQKGATVTVDPLPTVMGNKRQLEQLFQNLVSNALKYNRPGVAPHVHVRSSIVTGRDIDPAIANPDKTYHLVEVSDNGIGFDQKDADRIFNVFQRLHGNAEYEGSGVGLSIARKVVENHHGFIRAEGRPGEGATFWVYLPME
ncbi:MAG: sensor signal transduction histidine kinase [Flaviaesturariibacter sp.]|nr:sensor signal transduction histidine kinase [Flaviaesturariibacter sp.]